MPVIGYRTYTDRFNKMFVRYINIRPLTSLSFRETQPLLLRFLHLLHDVQPREALRSFRRGRSRRRVEVLPGTSDQMSAIETLLLIDHLWVEPTVIYQGRIGRQIRFCHSKQLISWTRL